MKMCGNTRGELITPDWIKYQAPPFGALVLIRVIDPRKYTTRENPTTFFPARYELTPTGTRWVRESAPHKHIYISQVIAWRHISKLTVNRSEP